MKHRESLIDQKIREAMERGEFDDLPGKGKPLETSENPFEDPEMRMGHRMLRNAGFAPPWIEERKNIEAEFEQAHQQMVRVWTIMQNSLGTGNERDPRARWEVALDSFRKQAAALNQENNCVEFENPGSGFSAMADRNRKGS